MACPAFKGCLEYAHRGMMLLHHTQMIALTHARKCSAAVSYIHDVTMLHVGHVGSFKILGPLGTSACGLVFTCVALEPGSVIHVVWLNHHRDPSQKNKIKDNSICGMASGMYMHVSKYTCTHIHIYSPAYTHAHTQFVLKKSLRCVQMNLTYPAAI